MSRLTYLFTCGIYTVTNNRADLTRSGWWHNRNGTRNYYRPALPCSPWPRLSDLDMTAYRLELFFAHVNTVTVSFWLPRDLGGLSEHRRNNRRYWGRLVPNF